MKELKTKVIIECKWGSKWQEETGNERLLITLQAIMLFTKSIHKKNKTKIKIFFNDDEEPTRL